MDCQHRLKTKNQNSKRSAINLSRPRKRNTRVTTVSFSQVVFKVAAFLAGVVVLRLDGFQFFVVVAGLAAGEVGDFKVFIGG